MHDHHHPHRTRHPNRTYWLAGVGALFWLLLRSGTNPRRLTYPCQRAALATSLGFLSYLASLLGTVHLYRYLRRKVTPFAASLFLAGLLAVTFVGSRIGAPTAQASLTTLPAWTSPTAVSNVFVVPNVPAPACSLDGGTLPATAPCHDASYALHDAGVDRLVDEMEARGDHFFQTTDHPKGIVGVDDVVVIKINNQWGGAGDGAGQGRLATNTDVLKGLLWRILQHPDGFRGEVVVAENTQDKNPNWNTTPANAQDQAQSYQDVVEAFRNLGYPVSLSSWDGLDDQLIRGGDVAGSGYPSGEYSHGNAEDAYILLEDPAGSGQDELSYPKFQTAGGRSVSMRYGVWDGSRYHPDQLAFINMPVLKKHGMAGATIAWKNLIGFVTIAERGRRYGGWEPMHDYFWGYTQQADPGYGLLGREMAWVRSPDLNVVDAIWVAINGNTGGNAVRTDVLLASRDPFAVDWYASEYVLRPLVAKEAQDASAARRGVFRNATRTNQNAALAAWPGGSYPYIDLLDTYDGNTPSEAEKAQMNIYLVAGEPRHAFLPLIVRRTRESQRCGRSRALHPSGCEDGRLRCDRGQAALHCSKAL